MTERVLSPRELNRAMLARQLLLRRAQIPTTRALEHVGGLQTQYAPSAYIGLWSRLRNFDRNGLTRAVEQRHAVQATLMRSTIHTVSAADYPLLAAGIRNGRRDRWLRVLRGQVQAADMERVAAVLRRHLADGPSRVPQLKALLGAEGFPAAVWSGADLWLDMVRVPPSGTWEQRRADLYGLADDWLGASTAKEGDGHELIVRRYLGGFGPAALNDIANWAGIPAAALIPVVEGMSLRRFRDERGGELLDLRGAPLPDAATPAPVRFLPTWDATLLVHARRTLILPERYRALVFHVKTPHSVPTFLVDGAVAGKWRYEAGRVRLEPFDPLPSAVRRELEDEADALAAFHAS